MPKNCKKCGAEYSNKNKFFCSVACSNRASKNKRHGLVGTTEHNIWLALRKRCNSPTDPAYCLYGGRGIKVCERWNDFNNFLADMGPRPLGRSLDRIDNDGNYEPSNCRWATATEQSRNRSNAWTPAQDAILRTSIGSGLSKDEIAVLVGRSASAVGGRVYRLGLDRPALHSNGEQQ